MSAEQKSSGPGPADLRLRPAPPQVMRLSRRSLAIAGAAVAICVGAALVYALRSPVPTSPRELYETEHQAAGDRLSGLPKDYTQVPRLGPPLPGDLGRPILSAQQRGVDVTPPRIGGTPVQPSPGTSPAQRARALELQERDAARTSALFNATSANAARSAPSDVTAVQPPPGRATGVGDQQAGPAGKARFLEPGAAGPTQSPHRIESPVSAWTLQAGSIIPAALVTGIRSDLPGTIIAQVTEPVYDSVAGRHLLIPQGSRLIGEYDAEISAGQNRVLLAWDRMIFPDGRSIRLDRLPGADASGYAGVQDRVDQHWGGLLRAALISSLLGVGTQIGGESDGELLRALRRGVSEPIARTGQDLVRQQMSVPPTLAIRPGFELRIIVTRDLILEPDGGAS